MGKMTIMWPEDVFPAPDVLMGAMDFANGHRMQAGFESGELNIDFSTNPPTFKLNWEGGFKKWMIVFTKAAETGAVSFNVSGDTGLFKEDEINDGNTYRVFRGYTTQEEAQNMLEMMLKGENFIETMFGLSEAQTEAAHVAATLIDPASDEEIPVAATVEPVNVPVTDAQTDAAQVAAVASDADIPTVTPVEPTPNLHLVDSVPTQPTPVPVEAAMPIGVPVDTLTVETPSTEDTAAQVQSEAEAVDPTSSVPQSGDAVETVQ